MIEYNSSIETLDGLSPLLPNLRSSTKVLVGVNAKGKLFIFHDKPLISKIEWVEYDSSNSRLTLLDARGRIQDIGMTIHSHIKKHMGHASSACIALINNDNIESFFEIPLVKN